jgi:acyl transferase domain-containing protein/acyl carrier protein
VSVPGPDRRALLKEALETIERLQARVAALESQRAEPIAIVGLGCRFPGGASTPEAYWALLRDGIDAVTEVPADRWDAATWARLAEVGGPTSKYYGGFLEEIDRFDPRFFGISPREATTMDPQQRLLLEVCWEALERAGQAPDRLAGSRTGVFVGITTSDYGELVKRAGTEALDVYVATGNAHNAAAGRVSYVLGLRGPSVAVDTACSSSLTAVHLACQSLRAGDSRMALAGGVNAILTPDPFVIFSRWGMMAPDGRCKTFDAAADGFVRGEGCGVVVLKRLSDALADGDTVLAVIRGSAVNQDGASSGLTVPNGLAQQEVIRQALGVAGVAPADVSYVEAHGTGTSLGDPIELEALLAVLGPGRPPDRPLTVGSVKTNLGHLESAAGVAGLIKVVLALQHREIPPHLHFAALTPKVVPDPVPLVVPTRRTPWTAAAGPRVAGVSSFGFSGTNAHVVLEEPPSPPAAPAAPERPRHLLVLSARSDAALAALAGRLERRLADVADAALGDVGYTLATGRARFPRRLALPAASVAQAREALAAVAGGRAAPDARRGRARAARPRIAFLFTGQGAQYAGMGRALYESCPPFRQALDRCAQGLAAQLDRPLTALLYPEAGAESRLDETRYTQPALFALEYALAETWRAWGVTPALVLGHSVGEYAAACVAGVLSLDDALAAIAARGRLMQALPAGGAMAAVFADEATVARAIAPHAATLALAAVNGPDSVVVSGDGAALAAVLERLRADGVKSQALTVSHAFHSPLMDPMLDAFEAVVAGTTRQRPRIPLVSNVTGRVAGADELTDARYWRRHVRQPVRFADGVGALHAAGAEVFVEIGPAPTLLGLARRCLPEVPGPWLPSLRKGRDDWAQMLETLGALHVEGVEVDWAAFDRPYGRRRVALPTYPFQRERCWVEAGREAAAPVPAPDPGGHPLLGRRLGLAAVTDAAVWEGQLSIAALRYLTDHRVQGRAIVPATAYVEMIITAAAEVLGTEAVEVEDIRLARPIFLADDAVYRVQLTLRRERADRARVEIHGAPAGEGEPAWTLHASAAVARGTAGAPSERVDDVRARCSEAVTGDVFYARLAERGNEWGPAFRGLATVWRGRDEALSQVRVPEALAADCPRYRVHPAVADAAGHVLVATIPLERSAGPLGGAFVGGSIDRVRSHRAPEGSTLWAHARRRAVAGEAANVLTGDVTLHDARGVVAELEGAHLWYLDGAASDVDECLYEVTWPRRPRASEPATTGAAGAWLVLADAQGAGERLAEALAARGQRAVVAVPGPGWARQGPTRFAVRPAEPDDLARVLTEAGEAGGVWAGVVHLWSLDAPGAGALSADGLDAAVSLISGSVVALVTALRRAPLAAVPRVWLVSRGSQRLGGERAEPAVAQAPLWGLGRSLAMEHGDLKGALVDLDPDAAAGHDVGALASELLAPDGEDQLAFRSGHRHVARLARRAPIPVTADFACRPDGTYVVTGGLGGLGLLVARWLVDRGARHLVLVGRSGLAAPDRRRDAIAALEAAGAAVRVAAADVGDGAALAALLDGLRADDWPPVRGLVHAAGVMRYRALTDTTAAEVVEVLRGKARGAWVLDAALADAPLDFFVLFSSASSILSSAMIAAYAAGNAFLDALAHRRHARGRAAVSINWGLWSGAGMAELADAAALEAAAARGMGALDPARGLRALARVMAAPPAQVAVLPTDWKRLREHYPAFAAAPFLEQLAAGHAAPVAAPAEAARIRAAGVEECRRLLPAFLAGELAAVLRLDPSDVDPAASIGGLGLDSLMSVEVKNRLEHALGVTVPMARLLEGPTVQALADELAGQIADHTGPGADGDEPPAATGDADGPDAGALSVGQQALWFMHHLAPDSPAYNVVFATRVHGVVDVARLQRAFELVVERHPLLGAVFTTTEAGEVVQRERRRPLTIETVDARGQDAAALRATVYTAAREPFDLGEAVLRVRLFTVGADAHVLLVVVHHIVFDAWSFELLFRDLCAAYEALAGGGAPGWAPVPARYADFARWQARLLAGEAGAVHRRYWEAELSGPLPALAVKTDRPRPAVRSFRGASVTFVLPDELTRQVKALAAAEGMTPYMVVATAYARLLHQESGQDDVLIGSPVAGRSRPEFAAVIGYFVNMLVLRVRVAPTQPLRALLRQVRDTILRALDHQDYPFALLVRSVRTSRDPGRTPVFQAAFNFVRTQQAGDLSHFFIEGLPGEPLRVGDLLLSPLPIPQQEGQFELELEVADAAGTLCGRLKYDPDVYERRTIERLVAEFQAILARVAAGADAPSGGGATMPGVDDDGREELEL